MSPNASFTHMLNWRILEFWATRGLHDGV
jgi:hypothetical protein